MAGMGIGSIFGRMAGGAAGGYALTGDWGGAAGGAGAALGFGSMSRFAGGLGPAGYIKRGLDRASRGLGFASNWAGKKVSLSSAGGIASAYGRDAFSAMSSGFSRAGGFMGRKALTTNTYAGHAFAAMGVGTGAMIGSSILNSNRGYR